jgi:hypothetical protein
MTTADTPTTPAAPPDFMDDAEIDSLCFIGDEGQPGPPAGPVIRAIRDWRPKDGRPVVLSCQWHGALRMVLLAMKRGDRCKTVGFGGPSAAARVRDKLENTLREMDSWRQST